MQFRLHHIFAATLLVGFLCGLIFAAPPAIGPPLLLALQCISPAIWFSGAMFARGAWRAFFVGGIAAGAAPQIATLAYAFFTMFEEIFPALSDFGDGSAGYDADFWLPAINTDWWISNLLFLVPGIFSLVGGGLSVGVYRIFNPSPHGERSDDSPFKSA